MHLSRITSYHFIYLTTNNFFRFRSRSGWIRNLQILLPWTLNHICLFFFFSKFLWSVRWSGVTHVQVVHFTPSLHLLTAASLLFIVISTLLSIGSLTSWPNLPLLVLSSLQSKISSANPALKIFLIVTVPHYQNLFIWLPTNPFLGLSSL